LVQLINHIHHIDEHLIAIVNMHHLLTYVIFGLIVFLETGVLLGAFLPGDSLLIACGTLAAKSPETLNINLLFIIFVFAVVTGNLLNYFTGLWFGTKMHSWKMMQYMGKSNSDRTYAMYKEWGPNTLLITSFIPFVRTLAPFVAGLTRMPLQQFFIYITIGAVLWTTAFLYGSYWIDTIPLVRQHLSLIIFVVLIIMLLGPVIKYLRSRNN
jgi:membrane-associated protein